MQNSAAGLATGPGFYISCVLCTSDHPAGFCHHTYLLHGLNKEGGVGKKLLSAILRGESGRMNTDPPKAK
jgi:hypothetical protein